MSEPLRPVGTIFKVIHKDWGSTDSREKEYTYLVINHVLCQETEFAKAQLREGLKCLDIQPLDNNPGVLIAISEDGGSE